MPSRHHTKTKTLEDTEVHIYNVPIKGNVGGTKKTIFYVRVSADGTIIDYACKHVYEMIVVTHTDVCRQISMFLSKKIS